MHILRIGLILAAIAILATLPIYVNADTPECSGEVPPATSSEAGPVNCLGELIPTQAPFRALPGLVMDDGTAEGQAIAKTIIRRMQVQALYYSGLIDPIRLADAAGQAAVDWLLAELEFGLAPVR